jgi:hypothetical protein
VVSDASDEDIAPISEEFSYLYPEEETKYISLERWQTLVRLSGFMKRGRQYGIIDIYFKTWCVQ